MIAFELQQQNWIVKQRSYGTEINTEKQTSELE